MTPGAQHRDDLGAATIWVLVSVFVVATALVLTLDQALVAAARWRAESAADAAALAAAMRALDGPAAACDGARSFARLDGARVTSCRFAGAVVTVTTESRPPGWLAWLGHASGRARAGPD